MKIRSIRHRALKELVEGGGLRGSWAALPPHLQDLEGRIRNILTLLILAPGMGQLVGLPAWRLCQLPAWRQRHLGGYSSDTWSISMSRSWQITFHVADGEISNLDLEDLSC